MEKKDSYCFSETTEEQRKEWDKDFNQTQFNNNDEPKQTTTKGACKEKRLQIGKGKFGKDMKREHLRSV